MPYISINQPQVYISPLPPDPSSHLPSHPTLLDCHRTLGWAPCVTQQIPTGYLLHMVIYICFRATLSICPTLSFPHSSVYSQTQRHLLLENLMKVTHTFPRKMLMIFHRFSRALGTHWWDHCPSLWWVGSRGVPYFGAAVTGLGDQTLKGSFVPMASTSGGHLPP